MTPQDIVNESRQKTEVRLEQGQSSEPSLAVYDPSAVRFTSCFAAATTLVLDDPPPHGDADGLATATTAMTAFPPILGDVDGPFAGAAMTAVPPTLGDADGSVLAAAARTDMGTDMLKDTEDEELISNDNALPFLGVSSVLQEFADVCTEDVPAGLPLVRANEHHVIRGVTSPSRAPLRAISAGMVQELLNAGYIYLSLSTCAMSVKTNSGYYECLLMPMDSYNNFSTCLRFIDHVLIDCFGICVVLPLHDILVVNHHITYANSVHITQDLQIVHDAKIDIAAICQVANDIMMMLNSDLHGYELYAIDNIVAVWYKCLLPKVMIIHSSHDLLQYVRAQLLLHRRIIHTWFQLFESYAIDFDEPYELCEKAWDKIHLGGYLFRAHNLCVLELLLHLLLFQESLAELGIGRASCRERVCQYV